MQTRKISIERTSIRSSKPFEAVMSALDAAIGHPKMSDFGAPMAPNVPFSAFQAFIQSAIGPSGFMEFTRFNIGAVIRKETGPAAPQSVRLIIGNPLIMKEMVKHVPDAASYAPVTVIIDERQDGVHLSYDTMASYLAPYGNEDALRIARDLDAKILALLNSAA